MSRLNRLSRGLNGGMDIVYHSSIFIMGAMDRLFGRFFQVRSLVVMRASSTKRGVLVTKNAVFMHKGKGFGVLVIPSIDMSVAYGDNSSK